MPAGQDPGLFLIGLEAQVFAYEAQGVLRDFGIFGDRRGSFRAAGMKPAGRFARDSTRRHVTRGYLFEYRVRRADAKHGQWSVVSGQGPVAAAAEGVSAVSGQAGPEAHGA